MCRTNTVIANQDIHHAEMGNRFIDSLQAAYGLSLTDFDVAWVRYVEAEYPKR